MRPYNVLFPVHNLPSQPRIFCVWTKIHAGANHRVGVGWKSKHKEEPHYISKVEMAPLEHHLHGASEGRTGEFCFVLKSEASIEEENVIHVVSRMWSD